MEVREKILNNLIINEKDLAEQKEKQFKEQQSTLNGHFDTVNSSLNNQTNALSQTIDAVTGAVNTQANAIIGKMDETSKELSIVKAFIQDIKTALYQPVSITDPDGKKWIMQREKPEEG